MKQIDKDCILHDVYSIAATLPSLVTNNMVKSKRPVLYIPTTNVTAKEYDGLLIKSNNSEILYNPNRKKYKKMSEYSISKAAVVEEGNSEGVDESTIDAIKQMAVGSFGEVCKKFYRNDIHSNETNQIGNNKTRI